MADVIDQCGQERANLVGREASIVEQIAVAWTVARQSRGCFCTTLPLTEIFSLYNVNIGKDWSYANMDLSSAVTPMEVSKCYEDKAGVLRAEQNLLLTVLLALVGFGIPLQDKLGVLTVPCFADFFIVGLLPLAVVQRNRIRRLITSYENDVTVDERLQYKLLPLFSSMDVQQYRLQGTELRDEAKSRKMLYAYIFAILLLAIVMNYMLVLELVRT